MEGDSSENYAIPNKAQVIPQSLDEKIVWSERGSGGKECWIVQCWLKSNDKCTVEPLWPAMQLTTTLPCSWHACLMPRLLWDSCPDFEATSKAYLCTSRGKRHGAAKSTI